MSNILMVGELPPPTGGIQTCIDSLFCNWISSNNNKLFVLNTTRKGLFNKLVVLKYSFLLFNILNIIFKILWHNIKIVHIHVSYKNGFWRPVIYSNVAIFFKCKVIFHMHGGRFPDFYEDVSTKLKEKIRNELDKCTKIIVLSKSWSDYYKKLVKNEHIIEVLPNSVKTQVNKQIFESKPVDFFFIGLIGKNKGIYDLLGFLYNNNYLKENLWRIHIAGPLESVEEHSSYKHLFNLENIIYYGEVFNEEKNILFSKMDAFILPSYAEALPISILEGMSFGLPIISTNVGAIPEIVDIRGGFLTEKGDFESFAKNMKKMENCKLRHHMGNFNIRQIEKKYSLKQYIDKIDVLYKNC